MHFSSFRKFEIVCTKVHLIIMMLLSAINWLFAKSALKLPWIKQSLITSYLSSNHVKEPKKTSLSKFDDSHCIVLPCDVSSSEDFLFVLFIYPPILIGMSPICNSSLLTSHYVATSSDGFLMFTFLGTYQFPSISNNTSHMLIFYYVQIRVMFCIVARPQNHCILFYTNS